MIPKSINVDGLKVGHRHFVYIDDKIITLTRIDTRLIALLAIQRITTSDGWIEGRELYQPTKLITKYLHRLKKNIHRQFPYLLNWPVFESGWGKCGEAGLYRLIVSPKTRIKVNYERIKDLEFIDLNEKIRDME